MSINLSMSPLLVVGGARHGASVDDGSGVPGMVYESGYRGRYDDAHPAHLRVVVAATDTSDEVQDVVDAWLRHESFLFDSTQVRHLRPHETTADGLVETLDAASRQSSPDDVVVLYLRSHGNRTSAPDSTRIDDTRCSADRIMLASRTSLHVDDIAVRLSRIPSQHQLLVVGRHRPASHHLIAQIREDARADRDRVVIQFGRSAVDVAAPRMDSLPRPLSWPMQKASSPFRVYTQHTRPSH